MKKSFDSILSSVTGFSMFKKSKFQNLDVLFYKDALKHGHHGTLMASSVLHRLDKSLVRFVFPGLTEAPQMTPELLTHIWNRAAAAGFEAHSLRDYGTKISARIPTSPAGAVSGARRDAEDAKAGRRDNIPVASIAPLTRDRVARNAGHAFDLMQQKAQAKTILEPQAPSLQPQMAKA